MGNWIENERILEYAMSWSEFDMSGNTRVYISDSTDPCFNLAIEDWLFRSMEANQQLLFLWHNRPSVVIGRFQNPWIECNLEQMELAQVELVRRQSGGGAVYHDEGNGCFTFLSNSKNFSKENNNNIILNALNSLNIAAVVCGRNNVLINGLKVSGSAFKQSRERRFHHGTMLLNADLDRLVHFLSAPVRDLDAKGIKSIKSEVANLIDFNPRLNLEQLFKAFTSEFFKFHDEKVSTIHLDEDFLRSMPDLNDYYKKLTDWKWRYGETPKFKQKLEHHFEWGEVSLLIEGHKGLINRVRIHSDAFDPEVVSALEGMMSGARYHKQSVREMLFKCASEFPMQKSRLSELSEWLNKEI